MTPQKLLPLLAAVELATEDLTDIELVTLYSAIRSELVFDFTPGYSKAKRLFDGKSDKEMSPDTWEAFRLIAESKIKEICDT